MSRHFSTAILFCAFLSAASSVSGQTLLDPNDRTTPPSGMTGGDSALPGSVPFGGTTPFGGTPLDGSPTGSSPGIGDTGSSFWSDPNALLYGSPGGYGNSLYGTPGFRIHPRMTREEIIQRQAEMKMLQDLQLQEQISRTQTRIEARQNMQRGLKNLQSLFNESGSYVPQSLGGYIPDGAPESEKSPNAPPGSKGAPSTKPSQAVAPSPDMTSSESDEEDSSESAIDRELRKRREELEKQEDSEQKRRDLEALKKREESRQRWLQQRGEAERGADFFAVSPSLKLSAQRLREGWCLLYDGKTPFGWRVQDKGHYGGGRFILRNGEIRSDPRHPGLLYTTSQFGDGTVMFEYQAEEDSEAYLLLRTSPDPRDINSSCYAVVLNSRDFTRPTGTVLGQHQITGDQLSEGAKGNIARSKKTPPGGLNWSRITAQFEGNRLQVWLDREEPITLFDASPLGYGYIGLLVTKGDARFRRIYWKPGSTVSLFDPVAPDRFWRFGDPVQLRPTREGTLQLTGGPGVFESRMTYENFVLQFEYNIAYNSGRSGVFFRSIPRKAQSGYEVSLQNFPTRADRDGMVGVDAGSFRGIKNGRYLRPEDQNWNYVTLSVVDRQFQTWVNGVLVCEMSDRRPAPSESSPPDQAPFLQPGSIQFLAPKAGTNVDFRNIRISTLAPRHETTKAYEKHTMSTWEDQIKTRRENERQEQLDAEAAGEVKE